MATIETHITCSHTELYINGGGYFTESFPTNFHNCYTRKMLAAGQTPDDYVAVTQKEWDAIKAKDAAWIRPPQPFIDRFNLKARGKGGYNEDTGFFELNGLKDITYEQALEIDALADTMFASDLGGLWGAGSNSARTNYPMETFRFYYFPVNFNSCSFGSNLEILNLEHKWNGFLFPVSGLAFFLQESRNCHTILGTVNISGITSSQSLFTASNHKIANFKFTGLKTSLTLKHAAFISLESFRFLIDNAANTSPISLTIHPDIYARIADETDTQWHALLTDAAEKKITIQTI